MGCWNGTCMISNLPIQYGDRVKLVILRGGISRKEHGSGYVYSHDMFTPSFFPISGQYNDYGMIESIDEDWNYQLIQKYFKNLFGEKIIADGETKVDYNLCDILDGVERGDLKYFGKPNKEMLQRKELAVKATKVYDKSGYSSEKCKKDWHDLADMDISETLREANLSFVMIREDIWDYLSGKYVGEFYNRDAKGTQDPDFYLTAKRYCRIEFEKSLKRAEKLSGLLNVDKTDDKALEAAKAELMELLSSGYALGIFTRQNLDFIAPELYDTMAIEGDEETREEVLQYYTEFTCISNFLSETRRGWMLQPGAGSQHDGWETHLMLAKKVVSLCQKKIKEYEE